jgi:signal transduction histidine kinase/ActR/RegA family two-component response regulator
MTRPIATLPIETEADIVAARQWARRIAEFIGFERQDQTRIATAVSEIARNAYTFAGGGTTEFLLQDAGPDCSLVIRIADHGPGIGNLDAVLTAAPRGTGSCGMGLASAKRLMDRFELTAAPGGGTVVTLGQALPKHVPPPKPAKLAAFAASLKPAEAADPLRALREQNRELMQSLEDVRRRQEESEQLSRELGDTNRGVVALYAELDERAEQLRQASELKSRFLSHMGHEFRTPLNSILALSRMLLDHLDGDLNAEQERQVGYIRKSAESLLELVNDLLDLSKVEAGKVDIKPLPFTVKDLFGGLRGALKPLQTNPEVELFFESADQLPELFTDEAKLTQILRNLISNALKFTETGEVRVTASYQPETGHVVFSVYDTGIGIAAEDQERIFEEFEQIETRLQRKAVGTGLGLPLSRNLAVLLGGNIEVESVVGQGSVFRLSIPASFGATAPVRLVAPATGRKRVLLIDDDEPSRYVIRQLLRDEERRYQALEASGGEEGLRLASEMTPAVIILDLQMPEFDGFRVLEALQANPATRAIPVIVATSQSITPNLTARLPAGIRVLSKQGMTREAIAFALTEATGAG